MPTPSTVSAGARTALIAPATVLAISILSVPASAEPYFAVFKGVHCSSCHVHPGGGGKRNVYGNVFAQNELAARRIGEQSESLWTGEINRWLGVGSNARGRLEVVDTPNADQTSAFELTRVNLYLQTTVIPNRLTVYIDQQLAPNASINREAYVMLSDSAGVWRLTAGQFYLPYGLRLQDDSAFVRQVTGVNFTTPDRGVQAGYEKDSLSALISVTNGSGGGAEIDSGKQVSGLVAWVRPLWRLGASANVNDADAGDRTMFNVFAGARTGTVVWLAEVDWIEDEVIGSRDLRALAGLIEGNWMFRQGHNIKVSYEYFDPDTDLDEDHEVRWSLLWEYSPIQFLQARSGARLYDGIPSDDRKNRDEYFIELHGFF